MKPNVLSFPLRETISGDGLGSLPFPQAAAEWLDSRKPYISQRTTFDYSNYIKTLSAFFSEMRLQDIGRGEIRAYQRMRLQRAGASIINHECCILQQMLKRIGKPVEDYQALPLPKESPHRALSTEEEALLYKVGMSNSWRTAPSSSPSAQLPGQGKFALYACGMWR